MIGLLFMLFMWLTDKHQTKQHQYSTAPPQQRGRFSKYKMAQQCLQNYNDQYTYTQGYHNKKILKMNVNICEPSSTYDFIGH
jgi:hypothetical protein